MMIHARQSDAAAGIAPPRQAICRFANRRPADFSPRTARRRGFTLIELLTVIAIVSLLMALLLPAVQSARQSSRRMQCQNNLRQMSLGVHNYASVYSVFPIPNWDGYEYEGHYTNGHSIHTRLLPYIERNDLYSALDMNTGARARYNAVPPFGNNPTFATVVPVFRCPQTPTGLEQADYSRSDNFTLPDGIWGATDYVFSKYVNFPSGGPFPDWQIDSRIHMGMFGRRDPSPATVTDGLSSTLMMGECAGRNALYMKSGKRVPGQYIGVGAWADPASDGYAVSGGFRDTNPEPELCAINCTNDSELYSFHHGGVNVAFGDGHVRFLSENLDIRLLVAMVTAASGDDTQGAEQ